MAPRYLLPRQVDQHRSEIAACYPGACLQIALIEIPSRKSMVIEECIESFK